MERTWEPLKWIEEMVEHDGVSYHTGIWSAAWKGTYEFRECISTGSLFWIIGNYELQIINPKKDHTKQGLGFTLEEAKELAEKHRIDMMRFYSIQG